MTHMASSTPRPPTLPRVDALQLEEGFTDEEVSSEPIPAARILVPALEGG